MATETERRELYEALDRRLGHGPAATMMDLLPPVGWADVARSDQVNARFDGLRGEIQGEFARLRSEMIGLGAELRGKMAEVRGELKAVVGKVALANLATSLSVAGLVLAAVKFF